MLLDAIVRLLRSCVRLVTVLARVAPKVAWPAVALILLWAFHEPLHDALGRLVGLKTKVGEFETKLNFGSSLVAANSRFYAALATANPAVQQQKPLTAAAIEKTISYAWNARESVRGKSVLWVNPKPDHNNAERSLLEQLGVWVTLATSFESGKERAASGEFDAIVTSLGGSAAKAGGPPPGWEVIGAAPSCRKGVRPNCIVYSETYLKGEGGLRPAGTSFYVARNPGHFVQLVVQVVRDGDSAGPRQEPHFAPEP